MSSSNNETRPAATGRRTLATVVVTSVALIALAGGAIAGVRATRPQESSPTPPASVPTMAPQTSPTASPLQISTPTHSSETEDPGSEELRGASDPEGAVRRLLIARNGDSPTEASRVAEDDPAWQIFSYPKTDLNAITVECNVSGSSATCSVRGVGAPTPIIMTIVEAAKNTWRVTLVEPDL